MKFRRITLTNFMRYKGVNTIEFSCDDEKNVTVVMGDNTFGKTTLAQAFRWGLYGEIIDTRYGKSKDIILLNKDVVSEMYGHNEECVSVEIEVEEGKRIFQFKREAAFIRNYPNVTTRKIKEDLWMRIKNEDGRWGDWENNVSANKKRDNCVNEQISMMFPKELSNYFFFDGERWNDEKKTNTEIKNSISTLMGITPLVKIKEHLYNGNGKSVIKSLESRITGSGSKYDNIRRQIDLNEASIEKWINEKSQAEEEVRIFTEKVEKAEQLLESNSKVEELQKEYKNLEKSISKEKSDLDAVYKDIVSLFSKESYMFFAAPLLEKVIDLLKGVDLEGKDIPDVTAPTLDYLIKHGICLCGREIGNEEIKYMEELKKAIPPNVIGSYVGQYQEKLEVWKVNTKDFVSTIREKADMYEAIKSNIEDDEEEKAKLEKKIDGKINFEKERRKMQANKNSIKMAALKVQERGKNIEEFRNKNIILKDELKKETAHTLENEKINRMITYAKALYESTSNILKSRQEPLIDELNDIIRQKFEEMFHEKEKYAQMGDDYKLHLYYKNMGNGEPIEELSLSEGEIIARNFVFIVSILELAQKKKQEDKENNIDTDVVNLPLVLDGPFSKLSDVNTGRIASVLPEAAEQVIVFMLDKDWEASGLEEFTLPEYRYCVNKQVDDNSATLVRR